MLRSFIVLKHTQLNKELTNAFRLMYSSESTSQTIEILNKEDPSTTPKPYKSSIEIRGIIFDTLGNVKLINEAWKKNDLCSAYSVFPRDLRKVCIIHTLFPLFDQ